MLEINNAVFGQVTAALHACVREEYRPHDTAELRMPRTSELEFRITESVQLRSY